MKTKTIRMEIFRYSCLVFLYSNILDSTAQTTPIVENEEDYGGEITNEDVMDVTPTGQDTSITHEYDETHQSQMSEILTARLNNGSSDMDFSESSGDADMTITPNSADISSSYSGNDARPSTEVDGNIGETILDTGTTTSSNVYHGLSSQEIGGDSTRANQMTTINSPSTSDHTIDCEPSNHTNCDVTSMERCVTWPEPVHCACLAGFARDRSGKCVEAVHYRSSVFVMAETLVISDEAVTDDTIFPQIKRVLTGIVMNCRLFALYIDINVTNITKGPGDVLSTSFDVILPRNLSLPVDFVQSEFSIGIKFLLQNKSNLTLESGSILGMKTYRNLTFTVVDPCIDPTLNYCHESAICEQTTSAGFSCRCFQGYEDVSVDKNSTPGETCQKMCQCPKGAICVENEGGSSSCSCPSWNFGSRCNIDGKVLFAVLCSLVASMIFVTLVVCCVCLRRIKSANREKHDLDKVVHRDFPGATTEKEDSFWIDNWRTKFSVDSLDSRSQDTDVSKSQDKVGRNSVDMDNDENFKVDERQNKLNNDGSHIGNMVAKNRQNEDTHVKASDPYDLGNLEADVEVISAQHHHLHKDNCLQRPGDNNPETKIHTCGNRSNHEHPVSRSCIQDSCNCSKNNNGLHHRSWQESLAMNSIYPIRNNLLPRPRLRNGSAVEAGPESLENADGFSLSSLPNTPVKLPRIQIPTESQP